MIDKPPFTHNSRPKFDLLIGPLTTVAREYGYALAVHGSLIRDIDLIAAPWVDEAAPAKVLAEAIRAKAEEVVGHAFMTSIEAADDYHLNGCPGAKPHGRLSWTFHLGGGPYLDLSVMPRHFILADLEDQGYRMMKINA